MFNGGTRVCQKSMAPLRLLVPSGAGNTEVTMLQGNNFSRLLPFSGGDLLRRQWRGRGGLCWSLGPAHHRLLQVMMLLTCLTLRNMISGGNLSFTRVAGIGFEGCVVGAGVGLAAGRQCTRHLHLAVSPPLRPLLCGDWLWRRVTIGKRFGWR
ncbi:hypothetical protein HU200_034911 [Digitaria exilis]|uniref:Uncharacterized protein n=1 Tax=Digitaria exilis TaxID=1010633 RepID=A0A835ENA7_9POAL|nr:hypothetical protein HU200_034911 [Digitaria exilis]